MNEKQKIGQAWNDLLKTFDQREMKRTLKDAYRRTGKMIAAVAKRSVEGSGIHDAGKLAKGVRVRVYPRGGGFMITVKRVHQEPARAGEACADVGRRGYKATLSTRMGEAFSREHGGRFPLGWQEQGQDARLPLPGRGRGARPEDRGGGNRDGYRERHDEACGEAGVAMNILYLL